MSTRQILKVPMEVQMSVSNSVEELRRIAQEMQKQFQGIDLSTSFGKEFTKIVNQINKGFSNIDASSLGTELFDEKDFKQVVGYIEKINNTIQSLKVHGLGGTARQMGVDITALEDAEEAYNKLKKAKEEYARTSVGELAPDKLAEFEKEKHRTGFNANKTYKQNLAKLGSNYGVAKKQLEQLNSDASKQEREEAERRADAAKEATQAAEEYYNKVVQSYDKLESDLKKSEMAQQAASIEFAHQRKLKNDADIGKIFTDIALTKKGRHKSDVVQDYGEIFEREATARMTSEGKFTDDGKAFVQMIAKWLDYTDDDIAKLMRRKATNIVGQLKDSLQTSVNNNLFSVYRKAEATTKAYNADEYHHAEAKLSQANEAHELNQASLLARAAEKTQGEADLAEARTAQAAAEQQLNELTNIYNNVQNLVNTLEAHINELRQLSNAFNNDVDAQFGDKMKQAEQDIRKASDSALQEVRNVLTQGGQKATPVTKFVGAQQRNFTIQNDEEYARREAADKAQKAAEKETADFKQELSTSIKHWMSAQQIINVVKDGIRQAYQDIKALDSAMTNIAVVTDMSIGDLWGKINEYMSIAKQYGVTTQGVYEVSQLYYQQGLSTNEVMAATTETLKMARIAGMDYKDAADAMTVAIRAFKMEMTDAEHVTDVYSKVAAVTASDSQELAIAMSKTASSAESVGSSFENTTAMLAVMIETTRESAQNLGSALKSIISRYGEMKIGLTVDSEGEEIDYNKVDTALKSVGISIKDAQGQFRDFDDVIFELSEKWDSLDKNTQRYIATIMAGNRQQSRFIALVDNWERLEEVSAAAADSADAGLLQYAKTLDSLDTKLNTLKTNFQQFYMSIFNGEFFKGIIDIANNIVTSFSRLGPILGGLNLLKLINQIKLVASMLVNTFANGFSKIIKSNKDWQEKMTGGWPTVGEKIGNFIAKGINVAVSKELEIIKQQISTLTMPQSAAAQALALSKNSLVSSGTAQMAKRSLLTDYQNRAKALGDSPIDEAGQRFKAMVQQASAQLKHDLNEASDEELNAALAVIAKEEQSAQQQKQTLETGAKNSGSELRQGGRDAGNALRSGASGGSSSIGAWYNNKIVNSKWATPVGQAAMGIGTILSAASYAQDTSTMEGYDRQGIMNFGGGMLNAGAQFLTGNWVGAAITGITTIVEGIVHLNNRAQVELENAENALEKANIERAEKKENARNLEATLENLKKLQEARYDSEEAERAYIEASQTAIEKWPELANSMTVNGEQIVDVIEQTEDAELLLLEARRQAAETALAAAAAENKLNTIKLNTAEQNETAAKSALDIAENQLNESVDNSAWNLAKSFAGDGATFEEIFSLIPTIMDRNSGLAQAALLDYMNRENGWNYTSLAEMQNDGIVIEDIDWEEAQSSFIGSINTPLSNIRINGEAVEYDTLIPMANTAIAEAEQRRQATSASRKAVVGNYVKSLNLNAGKDWAANNTMNQMAEALVYQELTAEEGLITFDDSGNLSEDTASLAKTAMRTVGANLDQFYSTQFKNLDELNALTEQALKGTITQEEYIHELEKYFGDYGENGEGWDPAELAYLDSYIQRDNQIRANYAKAILGPDINLVDTTDGNNYDLSSFEAWSAAGGYADNVESRRIYNERLRKAISEATSEQDANLGNFLANASEQQLQEYLALTKEAEKAADIVGPAGDVARDRIAYMQSMYTDPVNQAKIAGLSPDAQAEFFRLLNTDAGTHKWAEDLNAFEQQYGVELGEWDKYAFENFSVRTQNIIDNAVSVTDTIKEIGEKHNKGFSWEESQKLLKQIQAIDPSATWTSLFKVTEDGLIVLEDANEAIRQLYIEQAKDLDTQQATINNVIGASQAKQNTLEDQIFSKLADDQWKSLDDAQSATVASEIMSILDIQDPELEAEILAGIQTGAIHSYESLITFLEEQREVLEAAGIYVDAQIEQLQGANAFQTWSSGKVVDTSQFKKEGTLTDYGDIWNKQINQKFDTTNWDQKDWDWWYGYYQKDLIAAGAHIDELGRVVWDSEQQMVDYFVEHLDYSPEVAEELAAGAQYADWMNEETNADKLQSAAENFTKELIETGEVAAETVDAFVQAIAPNADNETKLAIKNDILRAIETDSDPANIVANIATVYGVDIDQEMIDAIAADAINDRTKRFFELYGKWIEGTITETELIELKGLEPPEGVIVDFNQQAQNTVQAYYQMLSDAIKTNDEELIQAAREGISSSVQADMEKFAEQSARNDSELASGGEGITEYDFDTLSLANKISSSSGGYSIADLSSLAGQTGIFHSESFLKYFRWDNKTQQYIMKEGVDTAKALAEIYGDDIPSYVLDAFNTSEQQKVISDAIAKDETLVSLPQTLSEAIVDPLSASLKDLIGLWETLLGRPLTEKEFEELNAARQAAINGNTTLLEGMLRQWVGLANQSGYLLDEAVLSNAAFEKWSGNKTIDTDQFKMEGTLADYGSLWTKKYTDQYNTENWSDEYWAALFNGEQISLELAGAHIDKLGNVIWESEEAMVNYFVEHLGYTEEVAKELVAGAQYTDWLNGETNADKLQSAAESFTKELIETGEVAAETVDAFVQAIAPNADNETKLAIKDNILRTIETDSDPANIVANIATAYGVDIDQETINAIAIDAANERTKRFFELYGKWLAGTITETELLELQDMDAPDKIADSFKADFSTAAAGTIEQYYEYLGAAIKEGNEEIIKSARDAAKEATVKELNQIAAGKDESGKDNDIETFQLAGQIDGANGKYSTDMLATLGAETGEFNKEVFQQYFHWDEESQSWLLDAGENMQDALVAIYGEEVPTYIVDAFEASELEERIAKEIEDDNNLISIPEKFASLISDPLNATLDELRKFWESLLGRKLTEDEYEQVKLARNAAIAGDSEMLHSMLLGWMNYAEAETGISYDVRWNSLKQTSFDKNAQNQANIEKWLDGEGTIDDFEKVWMAEAGELEGEELAKFIQGKISSMRGAFIDTAGNLIVTDYEEFMDYLASEGLVDEATLTQYAAEIQDTTLKTIKSIFDYITKAIEGTLTATELRDMGQAVVNSGTMSADEWHTFASQNISRVGTGYKMNEAAAFALQVNTGNYDFEGLVDQFDSIEEVNEMLEELQENSEEWGDEFVRAAERVLESIKMIKAQDPGDAMFNWMDQDMEGWAGTYESAMGSIGKANDIINASMESGTMGLNDFYNMSHIVASQLEGDELDAWNQYRDAVYATATTVDGGTVSLTNSHMTMEEALGQMGKSTESYYQDIAKQQIEFIDKQIAALEAQKAVEEALSAPGGSEDGARHNKVLSRDDFILNQNDYEQKKNEDGSLAFDSNGKPIMVLKAGAKGIYDEKDFTEAEDQWYYKRYGSEGSAYNEGSTEFEEVLSQHFTEAYQDALKAGLDVTDAQVQQQIKDSAMARAGVSGYYDTLQNEELNRLTTIDQNVAKIADEVTKDANKQGKKGDNTVPPPPSSESTEESKTFNLKGSGTEDFDNGTWMLDTSTKHLNDVKRNEYLRKRYAEIDQETNTGLADPTGSGNDTANLKDPRIKQEELSIEAQALEQSQQQTGHQANIETNTNDTITALETTNSLLEQVVENTRKETNTTGSGENDATGSEEETAAGTEQSSVTTQKFDGKSYVAVAMGETGPIFSTPGPEKRGTTTDTEGLHQDKPGDGSQQSQTDSKNGNVADRPSFQSAIVPSNDFDSSILFKSSGTEKYDNGTLGVNTSQEHLDELRQKHLAERYAQIDQETNTGLGDPTGSGNDTANLKDPRLVTTTTQQFEGKTFAAVAMGRTGEIFDTSSPVKKETTTSTEDTSSRTSSYMRFDPPRAIAYDDSSITLSRLEEYMAQHARDSSYGYHLDDPSTYVKAYQMLMQARGTPMPSAPQYSNEELQQLPTLLTYRSHTISNFVRNLANGRSTGLGSALYQEMQKLQDYGSAGFDENHPLYQYDFGPSQRVVENLWYGQGQWLPKTGSEVTAILDEYAVTGEQYYRRIRPDEERTLQLAREHGMISDKGWANWQQIISNDKYLYAATHGINLKGADTPDEFTGIDEQPEGTPSAIAIRHYKGRNAGDIDRSSRFTDNEAALKQAIYWNDVRAGKYDNWTEDTPDVTTLYDSSTAYAPENYMAVPPTTAETLAQDAQEFKDTVVQNWQSLVEAGGEFVEAAKPAIQNFADELVLFGQQLSEVEWQDIVNCYNEVFAPIIDNLLKSGQETGSEIWSRIMGEPTVLTDSQLDEKAIVDAFWEITDNAEVDDDGRIIDYEAVIAQVSEAVGQPLSEWFPVLQNAIRAEGSAWSYGTYNDGEIKLMQGNARAIGQVNLEAALESAKASAQQATDAAQETFDDNPTEMTIGGNTATAESQLSTLKQKINKTRASVLVDLNIQPAAVSVSTDGTVVTVEQGEGATNATGNVNGLAFATGTEKLIAGAHLANKSLVGELGPELAVYDGQYHLLGANGVEFANIPNDAIIFNHKQTEGILKGQANIRGRVKDGGEAFAEGNVSGPAYDTGNIDAAIAALKEARAMWQSLLDRGLGDLAGIGSNKGGGGSVAKAYSTELQEWYNLLRQIADIEAEINQLVAERTNLQNEYNGEAVVRNLRQQQMLLNQQLKTQETLLVYQNAQLKRQAKEINNDKILSQFIEVNEDGIVQYLKGNEAFGGKGTLEVLSWLNDASAKEQLAFIKQLGFDKTKEAYDQDGKMLKDDQLVQAFFDYFDTAIKEYDGLQNTVNESTTKLEDIKSSVTDINNEIRDNQMELEQNVFDTIVDAWEANIDALEEQKELIEEANEAYVEGLNEALQAERDMYDEQNAIADREQLQRQLSLLRRSGGSASEIADLEAQLDEALKDEYFRTQEDMIKGIEDANKTQIELLEKQITIQEDALEFQKENGVIWQRVAEILSGTKESIMEFFRGDSEGFFSKSKEQQIDALNEWSYSVGMYKEDQLMKSQAMDFANGIVGENANGEGGANVWETEQLKGYKSLYDKLDDSQKQVVHDAYGTAYQQAISEGKSQDEARAAGYAAVAKQMQDYQDHRDALEETKNNDEKGESSKIPSKATYSTIICSIKASPSAGGKPTLSTTNAKPGEWVTVIPNPNQGYEAVDYTVNGTTKQFAKGKGGFEPSGNVSEVRVVVNYKSKSSFQAVAKGDNGELIYAKGFEGARFSQGGLVDYTGPALVHGTKSKPEAFLNAEQTALISEAVQSFSATGSLTQMRETLASMASSIKGVVSSVATTSNSNSITIAPNAIAIHVDELADSYDVESLSNDIMNRITSIASKAGSRGINRR